MPVASSRNKSLIRPPSSILSHIRSPLANTAPDTDVPRLLTRPTALKPSFVFARPPGPYVVMLDDSDLIEDSATPCAQRDSSAPRDHLSSHPHGDLSGLIDRRYEILERLHVGGQGVVYLARDLREGRQVALKTWTACGGMEHYLVRREFDCAQPIRHPNLVRLYNLGQDFALGVSYFTMEFVDGVDFLSFVRRKGARPGAIQADLGILRRCTAQLMRAIRALHTGGVLHRDLKPSNVLVTYDGRVVVVDFGLAEIVHRQGSTVRTQGSIEGTVAYMAPDQIHVRSSLTPAVDLYAVGVMIFEAVTGRLPFEGSIAQVLVQKLDDRPPLMSALVQGVPSELDRLVDDLLRHDPRERASVGQTLAWCEGKGLRAKRLAHTGSTSRQRPNGLDPSVFTRARDIAAIDRAAESVRELNSALVLVRGAAGTGKSAFLDQVSERLETTDRPLVVLRGRCSPCESLPFRGIRQVIDGFVRLLRTLGDDQVAFLKGLQLNAAVVLFPVLQRSPGLSCERNDDNDSASSQLLHEAAREFGQLFYDLALNIPTAIVLEDVHLAGPDTIAFLNALISAEATPPLLLLASYRDGSSTRTPIPVLLERELASRDDTSVAIDLEPLPLPVSVELARRCLSTTPFAELEHAATLARSCGQNALLIDQAAWYLREQPNVAASIRGEAQHGVSLRQILEALHQDLGDEVRQVFELILASDGPAPAEVVGLAAGVGSRVHGHLASIREIRLIDTDEVDDCTHVDCIHELVRSIGRTLLTEDRLLDCHRSLAAAHHGHPQGHGEASARHLMAAGDLEAAGDRAYSTGCAALRTHAVDRAVGLFALSLECKPQAWTWRLRLAESLAAAGRPSESGHQFLTCARVAPKSRRNRLACFGVEQLALAGNTSQVLTVVRGLVEEFGIEFPESEQRAQILLDHEISRLSAHSLRFTEHNRFELGSELLAELDVFATVGKALLPLEPIRAGYLLARGASTALLAGEPRTLARNLALLGWQTSAADPVFSERLLARAEEIADATSDSYARGLTSQARAHVARSEADWILALAHDQVAADRLGDHPEATGWERSQLRAGPCVALASAGHLDGLSRLLDEMRNLPPGGVHGPLLPIIEVTRLLAIDAVEDAREAAADVAKLWPETPAIRTAHEATLLARCDLYMGDAMSAWERIAPLMRQARGLKHDHRIDLTALRGLAARVALALAARPDLDRERLCSIASLVARSFALLESPAFQGEAALLGASLANLAGNRACTIRELRTAVQRFQLAGMPLHQASALRRLGALLGDAGAADYNRAGGLLACAGVQNPDRWVAYLAPALTPHSTRSREGTPNRELQ